MGHRRLLIGARPEQSTISRFAVHELFEELEVTGSGGEGETEKYETLTKTLIA